MVDVHRHELAVEDHGDGTVLLDVGQGVLITLWPDTALLLATQLARTSRQAREAGDG